MINTGIYKCTHKCVYKCCKVKRIHNELYCQSFFFFKHCTKTHWVINFKTSSNKSNP